MLQRKIYGELLRWKGRARRRAFCLFGARQVGKTTIVRAFAKNEYACFAELNFIEDPQARRVFSGALDADTLVTNLTAYTRTPLEPGRTLVFLDEIQACPEARTAVKFLVEDGRFDYVESGSLLGVSYREAGSLPVGFEEVHRMFPMDLGEYFRANGVPEATFDYLRRCFERGEPVSEAVHRTLCRLFYTYLVVGGMPDAVRLYVETHDIAKVVRAQRDILDLYRLDIARYAEGNDKAKIKALFDAIPSQLNEKNRRFILNAVAPNGRQLRYAASFNWLADAGVALPCYNVAAPQPPLRLNEKHSLFKLFLADTGLLCAACMENIQFALLNGDLEVNLGSVLENLAAQQLAANGFSLNYYDSKKTGEIDFVVQNGLKADLIEVKSGGGWRSHPALDKIRKVEGWTFGHATVLCRGNVGFCGGVRYLPWYMLLFLEPAPLPEKMVVDVDLGPLGPHAESKTRREGRREGRAPSYEL